MMLSRNIRVKCGFTAPKFGPDFANKKLKNFVSKFSENRKTIPDTYHKHDVKSVQVFMDLSS